MKTKYFLSILAFATIPFVSSCTADYNLHEEQMTVAKAQREIKIGMSSSEVVEVLGSPNMVTTDSERRETWVYDKVSTNVQSSSSSVGGLLLGLAGDVAGGITGDYSSKKLSSNQRTLTIIVKFNQNGYVRDLAYRTSTF